MGDEDSGFRVLVLGLDSEFGVRDSGFRVQGVGFRVWAPLAQSRVGLQHRPETLRRCLQRFGVSSSIFLDSRFRGTLQHCSPYGMFQTKFNSCGDRGVHPHRETKHWVIRFGVSRFGNTRTGSTRPLSGREAPPGALCRCAAVPAI